MGRIKVLPDSVVRRIAAGEVIERPASVVKELIENSLDADAKRIDVSIEEGGKKRIVVNDDGCGMDADDLRLALLPHSTSKISKEEDIYRIVTLGFRGEALSSIRSVSSLEIKSRMRGSEYGYFVRAEGDRIGNVTPCAANFGTTVTVENLFFNLPARRKFLRSEQSETSHIVETVTKIALCRFDVSFILTQKSQTLLRCDSSHEHLERIKSLFGEETGASLLQGEADNSDAKASVFVAPPYLCRADARAIYTFVNNRCVREETVRKALRDAFKEHLPPHKHPVAFIFVVTPPDAVDANVHPAKERIQLKKPALVYTAVRQAIESALASVKRFFAGTTTSSFAQRHHQIEQALSDYLKEHHNVPTQKPLDVHFREFRKQENLAEAQIPDGKFFTIHDTY
ncbi:MAG: DNA mismatch repair endonuclease MutL, partial [Planctomycetota bacterium]|nr:DNA mismatch repair endonuclease MutL [Planctomycetota bacterium]